MRPGMIVGGSILRLFRTYLTVDLGEYKGLVHVSQIADFFINDLRELFKEGEHYLWQVISVDLATKMARLSWKSLVPRYQKDPFFFTLRPTLKGFNTLRELVKGDKHA